jgi:hypothetical protein
LSSDTANWGSSALLTQAGRARIGNAPFSILPVNAYAPVGQALRRVKAERGVLAAGVSSIQAQRGD